MGRDMGRLQLDEEDTDPLHDGKTTTSTTQ